MRSLTGPNNLKSTFQDVCRNSSVRTLGNEETSVVKNGLRADTAIYRGGLQLCGDCQWQTLGFVVDTTLRTPTADSDLKSSTNAASTAGFAADAGSDAKEQHHQGQLQQGYKLIPMVQESDGRMGKQEAAF
jgi:hypothetical protein